MQKNKVIEWFGSIFEEWLLGFDKDDLQVNIFSKDKFSLKNVIINQNRLNQLFFEFRIPIRLKAGIIGKINLQVSRTQICFTSYPLAAVVVA